MVQPGSLRLAHHEYTVGWVCALEIELSAALAVFDNNHPSLPQPPSDDNCYKLGSIGGHNVVLFSLASYGTNQAAVRVQQLRHTFCAIQCILMVGVGGGVPGDENDIRLGDVVVSYPGHGHPGVVQYLFGKKLHGGSFECSSSLNKPHQRLLAAATVLGAKMYCGSPTLRDAISLVGKDKLDKFVRPGHDEDRLFPPEYQHPSDERTCRNCSASREVIRPPRDPDGPRVHRGLIGSDSIVVKDPYARDELAKTFGVICLEMEAAGVMDILPCLVIRGICDYADSHKNKNWQPYASLAAAAYAKVLLHETPLYATDQTDSLPYINQPPSYTEGKPNIQVDFTPAVDDFLGRDEELDLLRQKVLGPEPFVRRKVVVLHGLAGIGKTQLALRFAREHKKDFSAIFWITANNRRMLVLSLAEKAQYIPEISGRTQPSTKSTEEMADMVLQWLAEEGNTKWLLILDDADQPLTPPTSARDTDGLTRFFPRSDHGAIIITTRLQKLAQLGISLPVRELDAKASADLLIRKLDNIGQPSVEDPNIGELSDQLGGLPLAISIAGSHMVSIKSNAAKYLQLNAENLRCLLAREPPPQYPHGSIAESLERSFEMVRQRSERAANLLLLFSCFDSRDIWLGLLQPGCRSPHAPGWFQDITSDETTFTNTIETLVQCSLILGQASTADKYSLHPVVHAWCQEYLMRQENNDFAILALVCTGFAIPRYTASNYWRTHERFIPHANHMLKLLRKPPILSFDATALQAIRTLGKFFFDGKKLNEAEFLFKTAFQGQEKLLGPENPDSLDSLSFLAVTLKRQKHQGTGNLIEAEGMLERALAGYKKAFGPDDPSTITAMYNLGLARSDLGKLEVTEQIHRRALKGYMRVLGPDHPYTLRCLNALAIHLRDLGNLHEAESKYLEALVGYRTVLGEGHNLTLEVVNNIGDLYFDQGKLEQARAMYRTALSGRERILGRDHAMTLNSAHCLAIVYKRQGEFGDAEKYYLQALFGYERALGPDHTQTLDTVNNLGDLYSQWDKPEDADRMYTRALQGRTKTLGPHHPATLSTVTCLAILYKTQHRVGDAEARYKEALHGYKLGDNPQSTLQSLLNLGNFYEDQARLKDAESIYEEAYLGYRATLGQHHRSTLQAAVWLGGLHLKQGNRQAAKQRFAEARQGYKQTLGDQHPDTECAAAWLRYVKKPTCLRNLITFFTKRHPEPLRKYVEMWKESSRPRHVSEKTDSGEALSGTSQIFQRPISLACNRNHPPPA